MVFIVCNYMCRTYTYKDVERCSLIRIECTWINGVWWYKLEFERCTKISVYCMYNLWYAYLILLNIVYAALCGDCVCRCGICSTIWTYCSQMSYGIVMVADVLVNEFGDAGATALCPLLEHQPNLKNLDLRSKCIVWLRYVHIRVVMCGIGIFTCMHMCALHLVYTMCGVMSCLHMNEMSVERRDWWKYRLFCI